MDLQLNGKVVVVTGGAKGIGAAIVRALAQESAVPVILDRDAVAAKQLHSELQNCGTQSYVWIGELVQATNCLAAIQDILAKTDRIDALVNNAGVNDGVGLERGSPEKFVE